MTGDYRKGIKGILSLHSTQTKPKITKSETDPYEDLIPLDTHEVLIPKETSKREKKERTDKKYRYGSALQWLTRPKATEQEIQDTEFWKAYNNSEKMVEYVNKYGDGPKITTPKKYPVKPSAQNKNPWRYEPWGSEVNVRSESRSQKARNNKTKEKPDGEI